MVRTKADSCPAAGRKVVAARAPRKNVGASSSVASSSGSNSGASPSASKYAGGNPVCPRPTPDWQKGIDAFFSKKPGKENQKPDREEGCPASSSSAPSTQCQPGSSASSESKSCASSSSRGSKTKSSSASRKGSTSEDEDES